MQKSTLGLIKKLRGRQTLTNFTMENKNKMKTEVKVL